MTARDLEALERRGLITSAAALGPVQARYPLQVSEDYLALIDPDDPRCPIRRQALPDPAELLTHPAARFDPIGDAARSPVEGLVHRYPNRALLLPTHRCATTCRFCFRKGPLREADWRPERLEAAFAYLAAHPEIEEVILTGGDPLSLPNHALAGLLARLRGLPHLRRTRIHSRAPATWPSRVDEGLIDALSGLRPLALAAHFNHPKELSPKARAGLRRLKAAGIDLLNQAVLLKGVNDDPGVLEALFEALWDEGTRPYYLHHLDLAPGVEHFRVSLRRGLEIYRALRGRCSGPTIPEYVIDIPGGGGKVPVDSGWVTPLG
ncbi:KamA family radical SAM protein, partial [Myxococcota bacterium]|nr:KamA family radical SAM protein [Myxococcota bacterium]